MLRSTSGIPNLAADVCMKRLQLLFIVVCCSGIRLAAQLFLPVSDDPFGVPVQFNRDSVKAAGIRYINVGLQYKPDQQVISDKGLREYYAFDSLGNLSLCWRSRIRSVQTEETIIPAVYRRGRRVRAARTEYRTSYTYDTVFVHYYYDSLQRLVTRRMSDADYYNTWYYQWNPDSTLAARIHVRETNLGRDHNDFRLGVQTIISDERFNYETYDNRQRKQLALNDEGKPYRQTITDVDSAGRVLEERQSFIVGGIYIRYTYVYDSLGRLGSRTYATNGGDAIEEVISYTRDSLGRLDAVRLHKNGLLYDEFSYLYDGKSVVPYAFINRRHQQAGIDIVKLFYNAPAEERRRGK